MTPNLITYPASRRSKDYVEFDIPAGDTLKIEYTGNEVVEGTVPGGKKWEVSVRLRIVEIPA